MGQLTIEQPGTEGYDPNKPPGEYSAWSAIIPGQQIDAINAAIGLVSIEVYQRDTMTPVYCQPATTDLIQHETFWLTYEGTTTVAEMEFVPMFGPQDDSRLRLRCTDPTPDLLVVFKWEDSVTRI